MTPERAGQILDATQGGYVVICRDSLIRTMIAACKEERREALTEAAQACKDEQVDYVSTQHPSDRAYNCATEDCSKAILAIRDKEPT